MTDLPDRLRVTWNDAKQRNNARNRDDTPDPGW